jgi:hypothetical protein
LAFEVWDFSAHSPLLSMLLKVETSSRIHLVVFVVQCCFGIETEKT